MKKTISTLLVATFILNFAALHSATKATILFHTKAAEPITLELKPELAQKILFLLSHTKTTEFNKQLRLILLGVAIDCRSKIRAERKKANIELKAMRQAYIKKLNKKTRLIKRLHSEINAKTNELIEAKKKLQDDAATEFLHQ